MIQGSRESSWSHLLPAQTSARAGDASPAPETASLASVLEIDRLYSPAITFQSGSWRALPTAICWGEKNTGRSSVTCHKPMNSRQRSWEQPEPGSGSCTALKPLQTHATSTQHSSCPPKKSGRGTARPGYTLGGSAAGSQHAKNTPKKNNPCDSAGCWHRQGKGRVLQRIRAAVPPG